MEIATSIESKLLTSCEIPAKLRENIGEKKKRRFQQNFAKNIESPTKFCKEKNLKNQQPFKLELCKGFGIPSGKNMEKSLRKSQRKSKSDVWITSPGSQERCRMLRYKITRRKHSFEAPAMSEKRPDEVALRLARKDQRISYDKKG